MDEMPTIHHRSGFTKRYSTLLKHAVLGSRKVTSARIQETFPKLIDDGMKMGRVDRENILSESHHFERTYFVKVITPRHLKAHKFLTWWKNKMFTMSNIGKPFDSFSTPIEMAEYEYEAATVINEETGGVATPHKYKPVHGTKNSAAIIYDFVKNTGQIQKNERTLKQFEHIIISLNKLHEAGYRHTAVADHIIRQTPDGEPHIIAPTGASKNTDKSNLQTVGYDLASVLVRYSPVIGTLPALNLIEDYYSDIDLIATYQAVTPTPVLIPRTSPWVIKQVKSSIDEFVDETSIDDFISKTQNNDDMEMNESLLEEITNNNATNTDDTDSGTTDSENNEEDNIRLGEFDDATPINE